MLIKSYKGLSESLYTILFRVFLFPKGIDEESRLNLTLSQLECLVNCILKEAAQCIGSPDAEGGQEKQDIDV